MLRYFPVFLHTHTYIFIFVILILIFGCIHSIQKFLGQWSNLSCSWDLCHSCSNARFITHYVDWAWNLEPQEWLEPYTYIFNEGMKSYIYIYNILCTYLYFSDYRSIFLKLLIHEYIIIYLPTSFLMNV